MKLVLQRPQGEPFDPCCSRGQLYPRDEISKG